MVGMLEGVGMPGIEGDSSSVSAAPRDGPIIYLGNIIVKTHLVCFRQRSSSLENRDQ